MFCTNVRNIAFFVLKYSEKLNSSNWSQAFCFTNIYGGGSFGDTVLLCYIYFSIVCLYIFRGLFEIQIFTLPSGQLKKSDLCCYCAATIQHAVASLGTNWFSLKTCGNAGRHCFAQAFLYSCYQICCFFTRTICWILDCFVSVSLTPISVKELNKNSSRFTVKILKQTEYAALACKLSNIETKEHQNSQFIQKNHLVNTLKNDKNMLTILTFCYPN